MASRSGGLWFPALALLLGGCLATHPPISEEGQRRCRPAARGSGLSAITAPFSEWRCRSTIEARLAEERAEAQRRRSLEQQQRQTSCRARSERVRSLTAELRRAEVRLADLRADAYGPSAPPPPLDEARQSRLTREDQELDLERDEQRRAAWREAEDRRRARWSAAHRQQLMEAQYRLNSLVAELRTIEPRYFTAPGSIEVDPAVARELSDCRQG